jgi:hypothetical protein
MEYKTGNLLDSRICGAVFSNATARRLRVYLRTSSYAIKIE